ncbi:hypothetical protein cypCar_00001478 [Cyprinus carpio]|nr:hypothetical protein cypCar_00001478 [Cyprinus carpio]
MEMVRLRMSRCYREKIISLFSHPCFSDDLTPLQSFLLLDPSENMREILQNVAKQQGVSNMRKLGHLNNFIKPKRVAYVLASLMALKREGNSSDGSVVLLLLLLPVQKICSAMSGTQRKSLALPMKKLSYASGWRCSMRLRSAGGWFASLRYLIRDSNIFRKARLQVDYLMPGLCEHVFIVLCIDIQQSNESERTQQLRLVRK